MNMDQFRQRFADESACRDFLESVARGLKGLPISQDYRNLDEIFKNIAQVRSGRAHFEV